ncbi:hypothetical protein TSUD_10840 [Trifolium subterraneum]|nr:hypothetical protein TSUD_10840 [Trifolium subterraneum]
MEVDEKQNERKKEVDKIANDCVLDDDGKPKRTGSFNLSKIFCMVNYNLSFKFSGEIYRAGSL